MSCLDDGYELKFNQKFVCCCPRKLCLHPFGKPQSEFRVLYSQVLENPEVKTELFNSVHCQGSILAGRESNESCIPPEQCILDSDCSENEHGMKAQPVTVKNPLLVVCFVEVFCLFLGSGGQETQRQIAR